MGGLVNFSTDYKNTLIRQINQFDSLGFHLYVNPEHSFFRKHGKLIAFCISMSIFSICQLVYFALYRKNNLGILEFAGGLPAVFIHLEDTVKLIIMILKKEQITNVIDEVGKLLLEYVDENDKKIIIKKEMMRKLIVFNNVFFFSTYLACSSFFVIPFLYNFYSHMREPQLDYDLLPYPMYYPFEIDSFIKYVVIYIWQSITAFLYHLFCNVPCDMLVISLMGNTTILFYLIQFDLENLVEPLTNDDLTNNMAIEAMHLKGLKKIISRHEMTLRLADKLTEIFSSIMLFVITFKSLIIGFFGFMAVVLDGFDSYVNGAVAVVLLFSIFFLAWPGQMLLEVSAGVGNAAYNNLWYQYDAKYRKFIVLIIARSQRPCRLSALGFTDITMETFTKIATSTYPYITLLNEMYKKKI